MSEQVTPAGPIAAPALAPAPAPPPPPSPQVTTEAIAAGVVDMNAEAALALKYLLRRIIDAAEAADEAFNVGHFLKSATLRYNATGNFFEIEVEENQARCKVDRDALVAQLREEIEDERPARKQRHIELREHTAGDRHGGAKSD